MNRVLQIPRDFIRLQVYGHRTILRYPPVLSCPALPPPLTQSNPDSNNNMRSMGMCLLCLGPDSCEYTIIGIIVLRYRNTAADSQWTTAKIITQMCATAEEEETHLKP